MKRTVNNSYFEKSERYIDDLRTDNPILPSQSYALVEPSMLGTLCSSNYQFDGQIFARDKKYGGNEPSSWSVSGRGVNRSYVKSGKEFKGFKEFMNHFFQVVDKPIAPLIITDKDILAMREKILNEL